MQALKISFSVLVALVSIAIAVAVLNVGQTRFEKVALACIVELYALARGTGFVLGWGLTHLESLATKDGALQKAMDKRLVKSFIDLITGAVISVLALVALVQALWGAGNAGP
jgi:hypothetical protein